MLEIRAQDMSIEHHPRCSSRRFSLTCGIYAISINQSVTLVMLSCSGVRVHLDVRKEAQHHALLGAVLMPRGISHHNTIGRFQNVREPWRLICTDPHCTG